MLKTKIKKLLIWPITTLGSFTSLFAILPQNYSSKITNWYDNLTSDKFELRAQKSITITNSSGVEHHKYLSNDYELKLLLNPGFLGDDEKKIKEFNEKFISKIKAHGLNFAEYKVSQMMPVTWFYFKSEKDREIFTKSIKNWTEIYKFLIYENTRAVSERPIPLEEWLTDIYKPDNYVEPYESNKGYYHFKNSMDKNLEIVNAVGYTAENLPATNIGVLEVWTYPFDNNYLKYFKKGIKIGGASSQGVYQHDYKEHSTIVSMISGGYYGVSRNSKIHLSTFTSSGKNGDWTRVIENMILNEGIRIINHSYGPRRKDYEGYNDETYFLDYISRKYGVINVISAGNDGNKPDHLITNKKLSLNSIVVGALSESATKNNLKGNRVHFRSNYKIQDKFDTLGKPLVVAPSYFYNPVYNINENQWGTSYAAPMVTGLISNLLNYKSYIQNSDFKVPLVKAILSASAITPKHNDVIYKSSGYAQKYGAGTVDFKAMLHAADNAQTIRIHPTREYGDVFISNTINLKVNQTIKISSSWTFNAGQLKNNEISPGYWNYAFPFIKSFNPTYEQSEWNKAHIDEARLKKEELIKRQGGKWVSDYDLYLERKDANGSWVIVKSVGSVLTNDELIEFKVNVPGQYRYRIKKFSTNTFTNSVDDLIAVTHLVRDEND
ncbi:serine protease [Mycoplasmopsis bovirhinis]|uniref:S8 family serine peptidase n=1 Tax=Mycoplasmopsis bovirhinis TaxID=29553 RepID=UPI000BB9F5BB|nr:S8 family serine peptidase [Mycoplasmopsis bovirhinis]BBA22069.1 serine protease [Mycoplasmopsis bovirhinis]